MIKWLARGLFRLFYRVEVRGLEHYRTAVDSGRPVLMVANHVSLLDGPLIDLFIPGRTTFMVDAKQVRGVRKWLLALSDYFTVDMFSPYAAKHMIKALEQGRQCMIFPEGRITTTGSLMKVYEGTAVVAERTGAQLLPIHIDGAEYSTFSYLDGTRFAWVKQRWFPKITLTILPPVTLKCDHKELNPHQRHAHLQNRLWLLMRDAAFQARYRPRSLWRALSDSVGFYGRKTLCASDINGVDLTRGRLLTGAKVLGAALEKHIAGERHVAVLLPNVSGLPVTWFALQAYGHVPAMLNFTAGYGPMRSACVTAEVKTIITSRKFVEAMNFESLVARLEEEFRILWLEDIREEIGPLHKLFGALRPDSSLPGWHVEADEAAVVLFTSGSEGAPKGVVLSHANILANIEQISAMLTLLPEETIFNALPTFHSFGMTAGMLWPILKGARVFLYPSPLHYQVIPEMAYQVNARLMFGTDTFYTGYARKAHPYDFYSIRAFVAGAERLRAETRQLYADKFGKPIYEGYGVTETSPVLCVNIPQSHRIGTVGQFIPGVEWRLEPVEGIEEGGRLLVRGPNVMKGYLFNERPGELVPPKDGWHDTGDIVKVDDEGFVTILGRAKRFAKIAGEMVSLTAVENYISRYAPEGHHAVVAVPDDRRGEQLVLVTDDETLNKSVVKEAARAAGVAEIMVPKTVILVEQVPILGTGKTNYPEVQKIAERHFGR
ncbi:AMP-binding protein [Sulfurivirga sp.]|uniref:AMP-binding protein n=1 Tax=Sulfurivirga sp. TaxID=2614236 RepID=UPI0025E63A44|nr:AMP-binding protein [Sulfurivirga sp.]